MGRPKQKIAPYAQRRVPVSIPKPVVTRPTRANRPRGRAYKECKCNMPGCEGGFLENRSWLAHQEKRRQHDQRVKDRSDLLVGYRDEDFGGDLPQELDDSSDGQPELAETSDSDGSSSSASSDGDPELDTDVDNDDEDPGASTSDDDADLVAALEHEVRSSMDVDNALASREQVLDGDDRGMRVNELASALWALEVRFHPQDDLMRSITGLIRMALPTPNRVPSYGKWSGLTKQRGSTLKRFDVCPGTALKGAPPCGFLFIDKPGTPPSTKCGLCPCPRFVTHGELKGKARAHCLSVTSQTQCDTGFAFLDYRHSSILITATDAVVL